MHNSPRIVSTPNVCHGKARLDGTRHTVERVLIVASEWVEGHYDTFEALQADYPDLDRDGIVQALRYAARNLKRPKKTTPARAPLPQAGVVVTPDPPIVAGEG